MRVATEVLRKTRRHRWPKQGESPLSEVAPGTAGVRLLVPSGLSCTTPSHIGKECDRMRGKYGLCAAPAPAHIHSSPRSFLLLDHSLQLTPSPLCGLTSWPLLGACFMFIGGVVPDLTWLLLRWHWPVSRSVRGFFFAICAPCAALFQVPFLFEIGACPGPIKRVRWLSQGQPFYGSR